MQGITSVNASLSSAVASVQGKTASARADSVDKVTTYEAKYRPLANKYNAWCVATTPHVGWRQNIRRKVESQAASAGYLLSVWHAVSMRGATRAHC